MVNPRSVFVKFLGVSGKALGVRLDMLDNIALFSTVKSIENLMAFLSGCGIKFLNIGEIFARINGKPISSFAIDDSVLTAAVFNENFPHSEATNFAMKFFRDQKMHKLRPEFGGFCDVNGHWLNGYALFCALSEQIETNDFSKWPHILRTYNRRIAEIVRKQLSTHILRNKVLQFFARKQLKLIKDIANKAGIFLCGDCDVLCEEISTDVWENQKSFFMNDTPRATVFAGLPPSRICKDGIKTTKVPHRVSSLRSSNYEFFGHMFSNCQGMFDAVFLINGHSIFQYWEIAREEVNPERGRWVNLPIEPFFEYMDSHFNNFPYLSDFNEPLLPANEVASKRHRILQVLIDGEPHVHSSGAYDLNREIFAISSPSCNRKIGKLQMPQNVSMARLVSCLTIFKTSNYKLCILHFDEICSAMERSDVVTNPQECCQAFTSFVRGQNPVKRRTIPGDTKIKTGKIISPPKNGTKEKVIDFFRNIIKKR